MFNCTECGTPNPLDSQFCKKCGHSLPADGLADARVKLDEFVDQGNLFFTEGRTEEALMVAEAAIEANPAHAMAYSLKGMCSERKGELADALENYEKAITLNPDSAIDKIKVSALRNRLATQIAEETGPDKRRAWFAGAGAFLLIAALGAIFIHQQKQAPQPPLIASNGPSNISGFSNPASDSSGQTQSNGSGTSGASPSNPQTPAAGNNGTQNPTGNTSPVLQPNISWPPNRDNSQLPLPGGDNPITGSIGVQPVNPGGPPPGSNAGATAPNGEQGSPPPSLGGSTDDPNKPASKPKPKEIIDIQVGGSQSNPNQPGAQGVDNGGGIRNGIETLRRVAANQYQLGQFSRAASTYEKLIEIGGDSAGVRQKLGQIYARLKQPDKAISQYKEAVAKYQTLVNSGINVDMNRSALATCQEELRLLGQ